MSFELFVALRYLLARRKQAFISLISLISVLGVAVGVMALLIALALMTGLQREVRDRIAGSEAHVSVFKDGGIQDVDAEISRILQLPGVIGAAPALLDKAMITSEKGLGFIDVKGIDPALETTVTQLRTAMRKGSLEALLTSSPDDVPAILIGTDLAGALEVDVGDRVQLISPHGETTGLGMFARPRSFVVGGVFRLGLYQFDSEYGFIMMDVARQTFGENPPIFLQLRVDDLFKSNEVVEAIVERFGAGYTPRDWIDKNKSLFSALRQEKIVIGITVGLIVMVAALNIVASLILLVMEKSRDIAILKTMGSPASSIRRIFVLQGLIIGVVGTTVGALAGGGLVFLLDRYRLIPVPEDVELSLAYVAFKLQPFDVALVVTSALAICLVATIYPSRQAARLDPAQALRYQ
jgi:lipoprotein-releasing system permease protein